MREFVRKIFAFFIAITCFAFCLNAEDNFSFYFRFSSTAVDKSYRTNAQTANQLKEFLNSGIQIDSINIISSSSPEGVYEHNLMLTRLRAASLKELILECADIESSKIHLYPMGEDWDSFREFIENHYYKSERSKILSILNSSVGNDTKKWRLQQINGGKTFNDIIYNYSYLFRKANCVMVYTSATIEGKVQEIVAVSQDIVGNMDMIENEIVTEEQPEETSEQIASEDFIINELALSVNESANVQDFSSEDISIREQTFFALKTNVLFDLATMLNYAVEVPIGKRISIQAQSYTPWIRTKNNQYCNETITLGADFRLWLGNRENRDRLTGHHIGLYGFSGKSDLQWNRDLCYQSHFVSAGLSYGFAFPIGKVFNLEFCVAVGWARIDYRHYLPSEDFSVLYTDFDDRAAMNYFGPTKLEVSLVLPIRAKKGGVK